MANLQSPGVQVQVIDESFYLPAAPGTTPMIFVASAEDKVNPSGTIAQGTTAANAGKVWLITSQRDLVDTFGTPVFYTDASGNPQHGGELNEYGLQAAYSMLGVSSRAYIVRADLNTTELEPSGSAPEGEPVPGTYWVDTDASLFGVKVWNTVTQKFTVVTPLVLDDTAKSTDLSLNEPTSAFGKKGDFAMVVTNANDNKLWYKDSTNVWVEVKEPFDGGKRLVIAPHYSYPSTFNASTATGSVWVTSTAPANGASWSVKYFDGASQAWTSVSAPIYVGINQATYQNDRTGGGQNIPVGTVNVVADYDEEDAASFKLWRRANTGPTSISEITTFVSTASTVYEFDIRESLVNGTWGSTRRISVSTTSTGVKLGSLMPEAFSSSLLENMSATWNPDTNRVTITHALGGNFELIDVNNSPLTNMGFTAYDVTTQLGTANLYADPVNDPFSLIATNWKPLVYEARPTAPTTDPADGTLWYNSIVDEVDIMYHNGTTWVGYRTAGAFPNSDPNGPIVSATQPIEQSDGTPLVTGDIWVDTSDLDRYGRNLYVYDGSKWNLQDVTDQSTPDGWLFADARWATTGTTLTASTIVELLSNSYLDPDAPDPAIYPKGMRLWNTRRSGYNVKKYITGYIDLDANDGQNPRFNDESTGLYETDRWVSQYPTAADGGPQFGRLSQRAQVVNAFKETIDSNINIRDTDTLVFNLLATPGYPEAIQNMISLNTDRKVTAFVVGDSPFRLEPTGTALSEWALNTNNALDNGDVGATSYDEYMAMWYPSGYTNDNTGNYIVVPPSHMMLRTIINSDNKSYQWFAPAGTRRGGVDNATSVGYITAEGEFKPVALYEGLRDVLYNAKVNPIATLTGVGVVAYGQKTRARNASALDRINVSRLVVYLRRQLDIMARPFLFEPNDAQTRREIKAAAESLLLELVGQRALYDFIVVCDETNNTPARIDRNELWLDIAIEPVKAIEFIYIPVRLKNTGDIAAGL